MLKYHKVLKVQILKYPMLKTLIKISIDKKHLQNFYNILIQFFYKLAFYKVVERKTNMY